ncbi:MAG: hypothetical protein B0D92_02655 [Spirochaeta sp. LUC14_002_19_P3]|nr:MAG: hypothetical protein B0D92_02655 [Spirochaeta sp. LUC14_002_19_P3]
MKRFQSGYGIIIAVFISFGLLLTGCPPVDTTPDTSGSGFAIGVYVDAVVEGFEGGQDSANTATAITTDYAHSVDSQTAVSVTFNDIGTYGGIYFQRTTAAGVVDVSGKLLKFSILKSSIDDAPALTALEVKMEDSKGGGGAATHNYGIDLFDAKFTKTENGNWYDFSIPVSEFVFNEFDPTDLQGLGFWNPKKDENGTNVIRASGAAIIFDNIGFSDLATYTVTYDANGSDGGTLSKTTETVSSGATVHTGPTGITKTGYTFSGWNTAADGSGTEFIFGTTKVTANITIYAQWTAAVADTVASRYYFLGDATGVDTLEIASSGMTHYEGYDNTITFTEEASGGADGTSNFYKLVGSAAQTWAAGGWGNGPRIDFTGYDELVFWAKVPATGNPATKIKFVLQSENRSDSTGLIGAPIITVPASTDFTTTWTKYVVLFTDFTAEPNFMQEAINEFKYELLANNHELHIDEMYLRAGTPIALAVSAPAVTKNVGTGAAAGFEIENLLKLTTVSAGATTLEYSITAQSVAGAMSVDQNTGILTVADATQFVYATNTQLTATVRVSASDGTKTVTHDIAVTVNIQDIAAPTAAATAPTTAAADVISVYSDTYKDVAAAPKITVSNWNPSWGQATVYSEIDISGNKVIKLANFDYQGVEFDGNQDVSGKTKLHIDLWSPDETAFTVFLVAKKVSNDAEQLEHGIPVGTISLNQWNSFDITLSGYTTAQSDMDLSKVFQLKFTGSGGKIVYIDNLYFY